MYKSYLFAITLGLPVFVHGAAGDAHELPFDATQLIRVIPGKETMPYQLAFKWQGTYQLLACLVADPRLTTYYPSDMAQQIVNESPSEFSLASNMNEFFQQKLSVDALRAGVSQNAVTALITASASKIRCHLLCSHKRDDLAIDRFAEKHMLLIGKSSKDGGEWRQDFYRQQNIKILLDRGEMKVVEELKAAYLAENEHDVAIEIDCHTIISKLAEIEASERRSSEDAVPSYGGGRNSWEPAQNLSEACPLL